MNKHLLSVAVLSSVFMPQASVVADELDDLMGLTRGGMYISGTVGEAWDYDIRSNELIGSSDEFFFNLDDSQAYTMAIGAYLGRMRAEFEFGFRAADVIDTDPTFGITTTGDLEYYTFMGNLFYDFPTPVKGLDIYVGGGAGLALYQGDFRFNPPITVTNTGFGSDATTGKFDNSLSTFAYQFMGGVSFAATDDLTIFGGYRFRGFSEVSDDGSLLVFREHDVHAIEVGLRIDF